MTVKKRYKYLIFDADHTLLSYKDDEIAALKALFLEIGLSVTDDALEWCHTLSEETWTEHGLYDVFSEKIQREYHALYQSHVKGIFEKFFKKYPCDESPEKVGKLFLEKLKGRGHLFPYAEETLRALSGKSGGKYILCVATNGLKDIQLGRLCEIAKYFEKIYVSQELKAIKPTAEFFNAMLADLGASAGECLMIGDSLLSDIYGAASVGMDTCWFNTRGHKKDGETQPTYEINCLNDLVSFL